MSLKASTRVVQSQTFKILIEFLKKNTLRFIVKINTIRFIIKYIFIKHLFYVIDIDALFYKIGQT